MQLIFILGYILETMHANFIDAMRGNIIFSAQLSLGY